MHTASTSSIPLDKNTYHERISRLWLPTLKRFNRIIKAYILFNFCFLLIGSFEIVFFLSMIPLLGKSTVLAFSLAAFFLTLFSYGVVRLYFQAKKPELVAELCEQYLAKCKEMIRYQEGIPEHHVALASAAHRFASALHEREYSYYQPPIWLKSLATTMEKFSCFCHWKDLHQLKELLLTRAVEEHIEVVKCEPTHLEAHAALANAYVMLSSLYAGPNKYEGADEERWVPPEKTSKAMQSLFRATAERAIEEFKILHEYAPEDPWVHIQLAYSYHDLQMPEEEIKEYETVLRLKPNDQDTLFKLGMLYFQQGQNAKGLQIYEILKQSYYAKAESLIKFYGTYQFS